MSPHTDHATACGSSLADRSLARSLFPMRAGAPPFALVIDGLSAASEFLPFLFYTVCCIAMAFATFKYRATVGKSLVLVLRKVTRSRR